MNGKTFAYWTITSIVALELMVGGFWDLARTPYVVGVVTQLGYPAYVLTILGACKVPGGLVLLVPRFRRLNEWAYAGAVFEMGGAAASQALHHEPLVQILVPLAFVGLTLMSWALRPGKCAVGNRGRS